MRGKLEVEGRWPRRNLRATCRAEGAMLSALSAAGGARRAPARAAPAGVVRPRPPPGPRGPAGSTRGRRRAEPSYPAARRLLPERRGASGPAPSRPSPAEAVLAPLPGSLHQPARKAGAGLGPPAPGSRGRPCSPRAPGMLCAASGAPRTPLPGDGDLAGRTDEGWEVPSRPRAKAGRLTSSRHFPGC